MASAKVERVEGRRRRRSEKEKNEGKKKKKGEQREEEKVRWIEDYRQGRKREQRYQSQALQLQDSLPIFFSLIVSVGGQ